MEPSFNQVHVQAKGGAGEKRTGGNYGLESTPALTRVVWKLNFMIFFWNLYHKKMHWRVVPPFPLKLSHLPPTFSWISPVLLLYMINKLILTGRWQCGDSKYGTSDKEMSNLMISSLCQVNWFFLILIVILKCSIIIILIHWFKCLQY